MDTTLSSSYTAPASSWLVYNLAQRPETASLVLLKGNKIGKIYVISLV